MNKTTIKQTWHDHGTVLAWVATGVVLGAKTFYTFGVRQTALAKTAGLKVRPACREELGRRS